MEVYDVLIIGGGPGGLTTGLYAGRAQLKTAMIEKMMPGGQVISTDFIENYPGFEDGVGGIDLMQRMEKQARRFGLQVLTGTVQAIDLESNPKKITASGKEYFAKAVVIATGTTPRLLGIPGEKELKGRGVSYCATCDGPFFKDKDIVVIGGGSSGVQESLYLTRFVKSITLVEYMGQLNAERILQERIRKEPKVTIRTNHQVLAINGEQTVQSVLIKNRANGEEKLINASGVFIWVGVQPNTDFLVGKLEMDKWNFIKTDVMMATSVPGVFAIGDVRDSSVRQITTAVGDGTTAAISALKYVESLEN